jgi:hypothetical protein
VLPQPRCGPWNGLGWSGAAAGVEPVGTARSTQYGRGVLKESYSCEFICTFVLNELLETDTPASTRTDVLLK